jgi:hypothetical protein
MSGRILIYDNATGDNAIGDAKNYVNLNGTSAGAAPTPADTVLYGAANYAVNVGLNPPSIGTAVLAPGANVAFNDFTLPGYELNFGNLFQPYGSHLTFNAQVSAGNVLIGPGATLTLDEIPAPAAGPGGGAGPDTISNLWNTGGTLINHTNLSLGGPGFIQTGGITSSETEVHVGINQWINLGNIIQGSSVSDLDFTLLNGTNQTQVGSLIGQGDGGFSAIVPPLPIGVFAHGEHGGGAIAVNTATLGGHWEQLAFTGTNGTIATTAVFDNVVKA